MQEKNLHQKSNFICIECKKKYDWAYTPTSNRNYMDAITKLWIRRRNENKKRKSQRKSSAKSSKR